MSKQNSNQSEGFSSSVVLIMEKEGKEEQTIQTSHPTTFSPLSDNPLRIIRIS